jgi:hypothetical protein
MFCHECEFALGADEPFIIMRYGEHLDVVCLDCAIKMDWLSHGIRVWRNGQQTPDEAWRLDRRPAESQA